MCEKVAGNDTDAMMQKDLELLFAQHLREHHKIETDQHFEPGFIRGHLKGDHTLIPLSIFSLKLSSLQTIVKYLRENEGLTNTQTAQILGRSPASVWITYRNACSREPGKLDVSLARISIPTSAIADTRLSVLECIAEYLREQGMAYAEIGRALGRDERTIWTVCSRARKKMGVAQ